MPKHPLAVRSATACIRTARFAPFEWGARFAVLGAVLLPLLAACAGGEGPSSADNAEGPASTRMTAATNEYLMMVNQLRRTSQCVTEVESRPEFAPIRAKTSDRAMQSGEAYSDRSRSGGKDSALVNRFASSLQGCRPTFGALSYPHHQEVAQNVDMIWRNQGNLYADLGAGSITWGQFNQLTKSNSIKLSNLFNAMVATDNPSALQNAVAEARDERAAPGTRGLTLGGDMPGAKGMPPQSAAPRRAAASAADHAAAPAPAPYGGAGGFMAHLASYRRQDAAQSGWEELQGKSGGMLQNAQPNFTQAQIPGKGDFVRVSVGPYGSRREAMEFCSRLRRSRLYCQVINAG